VQCSTVSKPVLTHSCHQPAATSAVGVALPSLAGQLLAATQGSKRGHNYG